MNRIYCLIYWLMLSFASINVFAQTTSPTDYFRSVKTGSWDVATNWESSTNGTTWSISSLAPTSIANIITIRSGNIITVSNNTTTDQTVVANGGILDIATTSVSSLTVAEGVGNDIIVQSGGIFKHNITGSALPTFNASSTLEIQTGGILEAANNNGIPSGYASLSNVLWADKSIFNWNSSFLTHLYFIV